MPDRMSNRISDRMPKYICQEECQTVCQNQDAVYTARWCVRNIHKLCQNSASGGDHSKEVIFLKISFYIQLSDIGGEIHLGLRTLELMEAGV